MSLPPKFLGQGSYGCVYSPPPKCKNDTKTFEKEHIAKVFYNNASFQDEKMIYDKIVNKVDPKHKFTPGISATCDTNAQSVDKEEDLKCFFSIDGQKQLVMQNKGIELNDFLKGDILFEKKVDTLFKNMLPVIEGVRVMDKKNYVHRDIKPANMLFDPQTDEVTLIDFGLATTKGKVYNRNQIYKHCHRYIFYPPEFQYICNIRKGEPVLISQFTSAFQYIVQRFVREGFGIQQTNIYQFLRAHLHQEIPDQELIDILYYFSWQGRTEHMQNFHTEWSKIMRKHSVSRAKGDRVLLATKLLGMQNKLDVYMLGTTCLILLFNSIEREMISIRKRNYTDMTNNTKLYAGLLRLIAKAVHANPIERITIEDFAKHYKQLLLDTGNLSQPRKEKKAEKIPKAPKAPAQSRKEKKAAEKIPKAPEAPAQPRKEKKKPDVNQAAQVPLPVEPNVSKIADFIKEKPLEKRKTAELARVLALFGIQLPKQTRKDVYVDIIKEKTGSNQVRRVWNPVTQNWVHSNSLAGQILTNPLNKRCKDAKVINPNTNRCVSATSDAIRPLLTRA